MTTETKKKTGAEDVRWDLIDLYASPEDPQIDLDLQTAQEKAAVFAETYRGRVAALTAEELAGAVSELETLTKLVSKATGFARLSWAVDTQNPQLGQLVAKTSEKATAIQQMVLFFELEWANVPEEVGKLVDDPGLANYRHYLITERLYQPYTLSEPEEKVISQLALTGFQGWNRYYNEVISQIRCEVRGEDYSLFDALTLLMRPDRELRQEAAAAISNAVAANNHTLTYVFNMILLEKASKDKMRGYESWISERNLHNQVDDGMVEALITAVTSRYDVVERYYRLLKQLLGYDELYDYDRYAPVAKTEVDVSWEEARQMVLTAFDRYDPKFGEVARLFFTNNWIDAAPRPGKQGGAFCSPMTSDLHPYIMMNFNGQMNDVMTLAHELGHGLHNWFARIQTQMHYHPPLSTAEMASTFCEMLVFDHVIALQDDPQVRFAMRMEKMTDTFGTVYRQISLNRFEDAIHNGRREKGELTTDQLAEMWLETQQAMYGDSVTLREDYRLWWSYIMHFVVAPGYVYSYSFGELLVWAIYARYKNQPEGFSSRYRNVLRAGGSDWPHEILAPMGVDLKDPNFWHDGLNLVDEFMTSMEKDALELAAL